MKKQERSAMLTPRKRITKKDLKEDKLITFYSQARHWVEMNSRIVMGGGIAVVIIIIAFVMISNRRQAAQAKASVLFVQAKQLYQDENYNESLQQFSRLAENYGNTPSGTIGLLYLGKSFYEKGDYTNAYEQFKSFASGIKKSEHFKISGLINAASCLQQQEQFEQAAREFEKAAKKYKKSALAPFALLKGGQCYDALGNYEQAGQLYEKIIDSYSDSDEKNDAILLNSMN